jgi:hypothetical protein
MAATLAPIQTSAAERAPAAFKDGNVNAKSAQGLAFAQRERFILKEDRMFLRLASHPHAPVTDF